MVAGASDAVQRTDWTYADWLELPDDGYRYEVIGGALIREPSPAYGHQSFVVYVTVHVFNQLQQHERPGWLVAPFGVRLGEDNVFQPDFLYVAPERRELISRQAVMGAPDLVGEVLSPSTGKRDLGIKRETYARHGVREYWIVNPDAQTVTVHNAPTGGSYARISHFSVGDLLRSEVLHVSLSVKDLFSQL